MIAIIYSGNFVVGYHESPDLDEMKALGTEYDLLDEVPEILLDIPQGHYAQRIAVGEYQLVALPPDPPDRIAQLETENLELKLALAELAEAQQTYDSRWPNWLKLNGGA